MKKCVLLFAGLLLLSGMSWGQMISDFSTAGTVGNWEKSSDSGPGLDSLKREADPKNASNGVMAVYFKFDSTTWHGRFDYGNLGNAAYLAPNGAKFLTFWVYLDSTQNFPDSLQIDTYAMTNGTWAWTEDAHYAKDMPKNVWYPLSFPLGEHMATNPVNFDLNAHQIMFGLQIFPPKTATWKGKILVDNIAFVGAKPNVLGSWTLGQPIGSWEKSSDSGPGLDSVKVVKSPTDAAHGVMGAYFKFDSTTWHGRFDYGSLGNAIYVATDSAQFLTHYIYLDSTQHFPDSLQIDTYAMTNGTWAWTEDPHYAKDIPKNVWYPLSFPLAAHQATNPVNFDLNAHQIMFGLQIFPPKKETWTGVIYVDSVSLLTYKVAAPPPTWIAADFESGKKDGFSLAAGSIGTLSVVIDTKTANASQVLQSVTNFSTGSKRLALVANNVAMKSGVTDSAVTDILFDMYLPNKMAAGGDVVFYVANATDSVGVHYTIGTTMQTNAWTTMKIAKLDSLTTAGKFDPTKPHRIGVNVSYPTDSSKWSGNIWWDNLVIKGVGFSTVLAVQPKNAVANTYELYNNYPNPFNPSTIIRYDVAKQGSVKLQVFDILGREVATLVNGVENAGRHEVTFNATRLTSGVYFVRMTSGGFSKTQRMMLLK